MKSAALRSNEAATLRALSGLEVLDSEPEPEFDALAHAAAAVCGVPMALVSLVDHDRQWFKANVGLEGTSQTGREASFCAHAVLSDSVFVVEDATKDSRFADSSLVLGEPHISLLRRVAVVPVERYAYRDALRHGSLAKGAVPHRAIRS